MDSKILTGVSVGIVVIVLLGVMLISPGGPVVGPSGKVDDWQYNPYRTDEEGMRVMTSGVQYAAPMAAEANLGFSVGGAKDINNFRSNIENDYLPIPTDLTYEGLFYDYYFDTGKQEECTQLFCPSYTYAVTKDPLSGETEYYMSVGLNSGMKESDFQRKKLNLVVVLDVSGSMSSQFTEYYYDQFKTGYEPKPQESKSKMEVASEAVVALLDHLNPDDRFGMVLYDDQGYVAKPLNLVGETDMDAIKAHIMELMPQGGTHMSAGMELGTEQFEELLDVDPEVYENRIIFLTDAQPNIGELSEGGLVGMTEGNADDGIYSTFIGIGVDFNTELIEAITKIRGANYYAVHSNDEFRERMDEGFDYMVTPLVFDLELKLDAPGYEIEKVYGSPEANEATGEIMKVNTLFPSKTEGGETKGGLVLLKLKKLSGDGGMTLKVSYVDREGKAGSDEKRIDFGDDAPEFFDNTGIRKGILLSRYADLMLNWVIDERAGLAEEKPLSASVDSDVGIILPPPPDDYEFMLGQWERQSSPLRVDEHYKALFEEFAEYFDSEMKAVGDQTLSREYDLLVKLSDYSG